MVVTNQLFIKLPAVKRIFFFKKKIIILYGSWNKYFLNQLIETLRIFRQSIFVTFNAEEVEERTVPYGGGGLRFVTARDRIEGKILYSRLLCDRLEEAVPIKTPFRVRESWKELSTTMACYVTCGHDKKMPVTYDPALLRRGQLIMIFNKVSRENAINFYYLFYTVLSTEL